MIRDAGAAGTQSGDLDTPVMQQYLRERRRHPDALLLFRLGDFYELFYDDAERASAVLGITLTSRSRDRSGARIPMAGVPVRAVNGHLRRLVAAGHKVAICEQMEDPATAKGLVDRQVVRIITAGTFLDDDRLDEGQALHLGAICAEVDRIGLAWVDLSTGKFHAEDFRDARACEGALIRIAPAELLHPDGCRAEDLPLLGWLRRQFPRCVITPFADWNFDRATARARLLAHFGTHTLEGFGCEHLGPSLRAAGASIHYLTETQRQALPHIARLAPAANARRMGLDAATHRALDLVEMARTGERQGSLLALLDRTRTPMGARLLREWLLAPLLERDEILARQQAVTELRHDGVTRAALAATLRGVRDLERLASRLPLGRVNGRDLRALEASLRTAPELKRLLAGFEAPLAGLARDALDSERLIAVADRIARAIVDEPPPGIQEGGVIRDGYDARLEELRAVGRDGVDWIVRFQAQEAARSGIPSLKVGYNRVFGYFIEVTNPHLAKTPADYTRKQTLKNAERFVTPALKEQEYRVLGAKERALALELELFQELRAEVAKELPLLQRTAQAIAEVDVLAALATLAEEENYVAPEVALEPVLEIREGRHPVLAAAGGLGAEFVPNDLEIGGAQGTLAVITGPNMAGKSTYIRQAALISILAQIGSWVPAARAVVGIADRIFTRVGAADELSRGQSTFMVEMTETANILHNATERSLVILDEVGRGTSTLDGLSLAWAIAEHLVEVNGARTLFATHYHELTELGERFAGRVKNLNVAVREWRDEIVFLHKILPGGTDKAYGIHVARLAGIPGRALARAREILGHLEEEHVKGKGSPAGVPERGAGTLPRQLDLFSAAEAEVARRLLSLDPEATTPLEALRLLADLRKLLS